MTCTQTYTCDQCQRAVISNELPVDWRQLVLDSIDADNIGCYRGDLCSPECAAGWAKARFEHDLKL